MLAGVNFRHSLFCVRWCTLCRSRSAVFSRILHSPLPVTLLDMKARYGNGCPIAAALCGAGGNSSLKSDSKVSKSKADEMQFYFSKLKELVPFMPKHRKLSKLEIIQYVIDYICDLQLALESHPATRAATAVTTSPVSPGTSRQPLGPIAPSPNPVVVPVVNACGVQEVNHLDKIPPRLSLQLQDMGTRPVSC